MIWQLITSFVLVTGGSGIIGVALAQLALGRAKPRAFASDLLIGAGVALAGTGPRVLTGAPVTMAALALLMSGTFLHLRERGARGRAQELEKKEAPPRID